YPSLDSFLGNIVQKVIAKDLSSRDEITRKAFYRALNSLKTVAYSAILTKFTMEEFEEFLGYSNRAETLSALKEFLPTLSTHQQKNINSAIVDMIKDRDEKKDKTKDEKDREKDKERERIRLDRRDRERERDKNATEFDETIYRSGIHLYLAILPLDTSLLFPLAQAYTKSSTLLKKIMLRSIENSIKAIGMDNEDMLHLLEQCPVGAESFVARVVHLLTERHTATREVVSRMKKLHEARNTDVRSLIPILNGLEREDIIRILPLFVLKPAYQNSVGLVFKKLLTGRNVDTGEPTLSAPELIYEYHKVQPSTPEEFEVQTANLRELLDSRAMTREAVADGIERLMDLNPLPALFYCTLVIVYKK
ncbi:hypothetical protein ANCDUO_18410, partial [Ancylostoma duodenale]